MKRFCILITCMAMLVLGGCAPFSAFGTQNAGTNDSSDNDDVESLSEVYADVSDLIGDVDETETEEEPETETEKEEYIAVTKISLDEDELEMVRGDELTLDVTVYPEGAGEGKNIIWSSNDSEVVTVDNGCLVAVGTGSAVITANVGGRRATCTVEVIVPLEGITLTDMELDYNPQTTYQLGATLNPEDTTDDVTLSYESSDTSVVGVDPVGGLHTTGTGTAEITVTAGDFEETCMVTVVSPLKKLVFEEEEIELNKGESMQLVVTPSPKNTTDEINLSYESSDEEIVSVDSDGCITALSAGSAKITVTSGSISAVCTVNVSVPLEGIEISSESLQLEKGSSASLSVSLQPEDTTEETDITYSSDNTSVATVDADGTVNAVGAGSAVITASTGALVDSCTVNVTAALAAIGLDKSDITIYTGGSAYLTLSFSPADTTDEIAVTWTSSDPSVATVSGGTVVAVADGTCTVTATVGAFSASCIVRVKTLASSTGKVIVLDPGHGGSDPGASSGSLVEKDMTLKVALYCKEYLEANYTGMTVYLTRTTDTLLDVDETGTDLRARCQYAASVGADIMVSLHFNGTDAHNSSGAMVIISKQSNVNSASTTLANSILAQLSALGIGNRGILIRESTTLFDSNGAALDNYAINRICALYGFPGVIVEHCFMDNAGDVGFCDSEEDLKQLGIADAIGIANALGLSAK